MTLNCYTIKFSPNFTLLHIFARPIYEGCRALTFALAGLSCIYFVSKRLQLQMVQACEIWQQFLQIVGKIVIFCKPKTLSRLSKIGTRDNVNLILFPNTPLREPFRHYTAGPLFKSRRRPCYCRLPSSPVCPVTHGR